MHPPFGLLLFVMRAGEAPPQITLKQSGSRPFLSLAIRPGRVLGADDLRTLDHEPSSSGKGWEFGFAPAQHAGCRKSEIPRAEFSCRKS